MSLPASPSPSPLVASAPDPFLQHLNDFFRHLATFHYDKAKDVAERMLESRRGSRHHQLCSLLLPLAAAERQYFALAFLLPKGFFQKDNQCKQSYDSLRVELSKTCQDASPSSSSLLSRLSRRLCSLASFRVRMMEIYEGLWAANGGGGGGDAPNFRGLALNVRHATAEHLEGMEEEPGLRFLSAYLGWEMGILAGYARCILKTARCDFHGAMQEMEKTSSHRRRWISLVRGSRDPPRALPSLMAGLGLGLAMAGAAGGGGGGGATGGGGPGHQEQLIRKGDPPLFVWLARTLRDAALAKLTFYFDASISLGALDQEEHEKNRKARLANDICGRMSSFQRRTDAYCVAAVYDASDEDEEGGDGGHLQGEGGGESGREDPSSSSSPYRGWPAPPYPPPNASSSSPSSYHLDLTPDSASTVGLELFPAIFCSPEWPHPSPHWPSVVMMLGNFRGELDRQLGGRHSAAVYFHDPRADMTYFLARLDPPRLTAVLMYRGRRPQTDAQVAAFLRETAAAVRCSAAMAKLKPGSN